MNLRIILLTGCQLFVCCTPSGDAIVKQAQADVRSLVKVGDNIFAARDKLRSAGFQSSDPYFATVEKSSYRIDIDYKGAAPTEFEGFTYAFGLPRSKSNLVSGYAYARADGTIYEIK